MTSGIQRIYIPLGLAPFAQISILGGNVDGTMDALVLDEAGILASPVIVLGGPPGGGTPRRDGIHLALGLDLDGDGLGELLLDARLTSASASWTSMTALARAL